MKKSNRLRFEPNCEYNDRALIGRGVFQFVLEVDILLDLYEAIHLGWGSERAREDLEVLIGWDRVQWGGGWEGFWWSWGGVK